MNRILSDIYFDPEKAGSFSSPIQLFREVRKNGHENITLSQVKIFLRSIEVYTLHKNVKHKKRKERSTNKIVAPYIKYQADADLADLTYYWKSNGGYKYFLLCIDVFSRYVFTVALKTKSGDEMVKAFESIFNKGYVMERCRSDGGSEFTNFKVKSLFDDYNIIQIIARNTSKASLAERAIQTIKSKLFRYMEYNNTHNWIDVLDKITMSYNKTHHRIIGMAPINVTKEMEGAMWKRVYLPRLKPVKPLKSDVKRRKPYKKFNLKKGDNVRISFTREPFRRFYDENWSREVFVIDSREFKRGAAEYKLKDFNGDEVLGVFYENELQKIVEDENREYRVEKIIKSKGKGKNKQHFVKWMGWPKKFNSWIPHDEIRNIPPV